MCACMHAHTCMHKVSIHLGKHLGVKFLGHMGVFNFIKYCQTIFQNNCTIFHSYQQWMRIPVVPQFYQHFLPSGLFFFNLVNSNGCVMIYIYNCGVILQAQHFMDLSLLSHYNQCFCCIIHDGVHLLHFPIDSPNNRHSNCIQIICHLFSLFITIPRISRVLYFVFISKLFHGQGRIISKQYSNHIPKSPCVDWIVKWKHFSMKHRLHAKCGIIQLPATKDYLIKYYDFWFIFNNFYFPFSSLAFFLSFPFILSNKCLLEDLPF